MRQSNERHLQKMPIQIKLNSQEQKIHHFLLSSQIILERHIFRLDQVEKLDRQRLKNHSISLAKKFKNLNYQLIASNSLNSRILLSVAMTP